ncbi:glycoside hydrolase family 15 protein [Roseixanthobacter glucoisosaccharinicivorans]|uniref:glycoside hydrolase family 15 protein n=1 Tax=Roseixanthobacter glucoisosaccharinicivorans TaxID=3119923 RepID=UPI00372AF797
MTHRIEDYAMIGDCRTAALVSTSGSIDWLCLPRFDSPSCFSSLIGTQDHGFWQIAPTAQTQRVSRRYLDGSLVVATEFRTKQGRVELVDFMPIGHRGSHVVRIVRGLAGRVKMGCSVMVRFGYGEVVPWAEKPDDNTVWFISGPDMLVLRSSVPLEAHDQLASGTFTLAKGDEASFVLSYGQSYSEPPGAIGADAELRTTTEFWTEWSDRCAAADRWTDAVKRSLITLKGLSYGPSGGIVAAATTSLPEMLGSTRNWDYRYCWIRDAAFTLLAFLRAGHYDEAHSFRDWLLRAVAGSPQELQIMYGVAGERKLQEAEIPWLPGYENSAPVRVGNAAATQYQLDIYGELFDALTLAARSGLTPVDRSPKLRHIILEHLQQVWKEPDSGMWEVRGEPQHFTLSKVMAWVAFDRAAAHEGLTPDEQDRSHYRRIADEIHADICSRGIDPERGCFTQAYGSGHMDAGLLLLAPVGFLPASDERVLRTIEEVERRLLRDGLIIRYETETDIDGLPPGEGAFLACSFWLVENYVLQDRLKDAEKIFDRLVGLANDVGLLAEEYDPHEKRFLGNFPQALSHVALVNSGFALARAKRREPLNGRDPTL